MLDWPSIVKYIAIAAMIFGMIVIVLTGGRAEKTKGAQIGQGLYSLYGITSYIGDLVSYTRLMALGLSGGCIAGAGTFLERGWDAKRSERAAGKYPVRMRISVRPGSGAAPCHPSWKPDGRRRG